MCLLEFTFVYFAKNTVKRNYLTLTTCAVGLNFGIRSNVMALKSSVMAFDIGPLSFTLNLRRRYID